MLMKKKYQLRLVTAVAFALSACSLLGGSTPDKASAQRKTASSQPNDALVYSVRAYGARGDGKTVDTPSVNRAIEAAAAMGGGTVRFPAGTYLCFSIRLKSNVSLHLDAGATILAADPEKDRGSYDQPEPN